MSKPLERLVVDKRDIFDEIKSHPISVKVKEAASKFFGCDAYVDPDKVEFSVNLGGINNYWFQFRTWDGKDIPQMLAFPKEIVTKSVEEIYDYLVKKYENNKTLEG